MQIKIFTLPFDEKTEGFADELVDQFCRNKKIYRIETHFFRQSGNAFWSVAVHYDTVLVKAKDKVRELDEVQQLLYHRLREWRKETGQIAGIPVYIIATNAQLIQMIKVPCKTLDSFKLVKGFGAKRIGKYGRKINELIKGFYEELAEKKPAIDDKEAGELKPPFAAE